MTASYDDAVIHDTNNNGYIRETSAGDTYYLAPSGSIARTGLNAGVLSMYPDSSATIAGTFYATGEAIDAATATSITITRSGQLLSTGLLALHSDYLNGTDRGFSLTNAGLVSGHNGSVYAVDDIFSINNSGSILLDATSTSGNALELSYSDDGVVQNPSIAIQNTGLIQGLTAGIVIDSDTLGAQIYNSGTIVASRGPAILAGDGADSIVNDGILVGGVRLGGGDDVFDSSHGSIHGIVYGGAGNDTLIGSLTSATTFDGGTGADAMTGGSDHDTASYADAASGGVTASLVNPELNTGDAAGDTYVSIENLTGSAFADTLTGDANANALDGGAGADTMAGGDGGDWYVVDNVGDVVIEQANQGNDLVLASVSYTLSANVERLTLTGTAAINGTGNDLANILTGNSASNILDGKAGADTMVGGDGADYYFVDNPGDVVVEQANQGNDIVYSSVSYTLAANVERMALMGTANINATGNDLANTLTGNAGDNVLDGKAGADTMVGGAGNDTYYVDNAGDIVTEAANGGNDTVHTTITYTLSANVENGVLDGTAGIGLSGNDLANTLTGNSGANFLDGKAGADTMIGGDGSDFYYVDNVGDIVTELANQGNDLVHSTISYTLTDNVERLVLDGTANINGTGNALANTITGNTGNNVLTGGGALDTFVYAVAAFGQDEITDFKAGTAVDHDVIQFSHTLFANYAAVMAAATQVGDNVVITYDANDTITLDHVAVASLVSADFVFV